jgi:hypothetical protein
MLVGVYGARGFPITKMLRPWSPFLSFTKRNQLPNFIADSSLNQEAHTGNAGDIGRTTARDISARTSLTIYKVRIDSLAYSYVVTQCSSSRWAPFCLPRNSSTYLPSNPSHASQSGRTALNLMQPEMPTQHNLLSLPNALNDDERASTPFRRADEESCEQTDSYWRENPLICSPRFHQPRIKPNVR